MTHAATAAAAAPPVPSVPTAPTPLELPFKLIGVAEDAGVRTAILSSPSQLLMVKEGDLVASKYRVTAISPDAIELTDIAAGPSLRLALK